VEPGIGEPDADATGASVPAWERSGGRRRRPRRPRPAVGRDRHGSERYDEDDAEPRQAYTRHSRHDRLPWVTAERMAPGHDPRNHTDPVVSSPSERWNPGQGDPRTGALLPEPGHPIDARTP